MPRMKLEAGATYDAEGATVTVLAQTGDDTFSVRWGKTGSSGMCGDRLRMLLQGAGAKKVGSAPAPASAKGTPRKKPAAKKKVSK